MLSRLKIQHVVFASVFLAFILVNGDKIFDPDIWWHLKAGEYIWQNKIIPKTDFYSFSNTGHLWITHEWLAEVVFYLAGRAADFYGLFIFNLGLLTAVYFLFGRLIYLRADKDLTLTSVILVTGMVFSSLFWVFRPHLIAYLFFVSYLLILELFHRGKDYTWLLPLLMMLWVNTHGSYIMGVVLVVLNIAAGAYSFNIGRLTTEALSRTQLRKLSLVLVLIIAAIFVNPNTYKLVYYPFFTLNSKVMMDNIAEWSSPNFHLPVFKAFLAYFFMVFVTVMVSKRPVKLIDLLYLGLFTYLAMFGTRNVALFMFVSGPIVAEYGADLVNKSRSQLQITWLNWIALALVLLYSVYALPPQTPVSQRADGSVFPLQAVEFMRRNDLKGTVFNEYNWGGYLIWARFPDNKVFIDGRSDIYEDKVLPDYITRTKMQPEAYRLLQRYNPDYILLTAKAPLNLLLGVNSDWQLIYGDKVAKLYQRRALLQLN